MTDALMGYSKKQLEFARELYDLFARYHYYTHDDEWSPTCFFTNYGLEDKGNFSFEVTTFNNKLRFWFPVACDARSLFEAEIAVHNSHQEERKKQGHPQHYVVPRVAAFLIMNASGVSGMAEALLFDGGGDYQTIEKLLSIDRIRNLPRFCEEG